MHRFIMRLLDLAWIVFLLEGLSVSGVSGWNCSAMLNEKCTEMDDCCIGTCFAGHCNDGLYKNNQDRSTGRASPSRLISLEMATGSNIDVSNHPNIKLLPSLEECGQSIIEIKPSRSKRIVGGTPYDLGKYPWAGSLHKTKIGELASTFQCGGSLISSRYVISAAHCVTRLWSGHMLKWVTLGNVDRRLKLSCDPVPNNNSGICSDDHFLDVEVEEWVVHEAYSEAHVRNDIALIRLKHEVVYTDNIKPICLPRSEQIFKKWLNGLTTVIGWGAQNDANDVGPPKISPVAQEVEQWLVHRSICDRFFTRVIGNLRRSQICVGGYPGKGDCGGDSGGALFKSIPMDDDDYESDENTEKHYTQSPTYVRPTETPKERYFLFGLVSTGASTKCAREGRPSVHTNVIYFLPWILDNMVKRDDTGEKIFPIKLPVIPTEEFATGYDPPMDVTGHKHIGLLPQFPACGVTPGQQEHVGPAKRNLDEGPEYRVRKKRVVGGIIQSIGAFPWMAQIYVKHIVTGDLIFRCGGALISHRHVLTGAHCVSEIRGNYALDSVIIGNFNRFEKVECIYSECVGQKAIPIENVVIHEAYAKFAKEHDVAVIHLAHNVVFNRFVQPICLPLKEDYVAQAWPNPDRDRRYVTAGWGKVVSESEEKTGEISNVLVAVNLTLESRKFCETVLVRKSGKLEKTRVCGGGTIPGRGECIGDTGSPMMRLVTLPGPNGQNHTRMFSFGILSVVECATQGIPSLYQNLLYHMPWIMDHLEH